MCDYSCVWLPAAKRCPTHTITNATERAHVLIKIGDHTLCVRMSVRQLAERASTSTRNIISWHVLANMRCVQHARMLCVCVDWLLLCGMERERERATDDGCMATFVWLNVRTKNGSPGPRTIRVSAQRQKPIQFLCVCVFVCVHNAALHLPTLLCCAS